MGLRGNPATQLELDPLEAALAVLEAVTATDSELAAAVATLTAGIALKQDAATAASDAELSAAVATLNATMSTDAELAAAVANVNTALGLKQDALTAATDAELAAAVAAINTALAAKQDAATAATDAEVTSLLAPVTTHIANTANPHAVTKAQVGLALVDNTPDTGKPVSVAQQAAIDADRARLLSVESGSLWDSPTEADVLTFVSGLPAWRPPSGGAPTVVSAGNLGATHSETVAAGRQTWLVGTLNANHTLTVTLGAGSSLLGIFTQDATGGRALTVAHGADTPVAVDVPATASATFAVEIRSTNGTDILIEVVGASGPRGLTGATGNTGAGIVFRGAWAPATVYNALDAVTFGGSLFGTGTSLLSGASFDGTEQARWSLWASKGNTGEGAPVYGLLADRPPAGVAGDRALFVATDNAFAVYQVQAGAWVQITKGTTVRENTTIYAPGSYALTPPVWALRMRCRLVTGGSGAGSGRKGAAGSVRCAGGAGSGGGMSDYEFKVADLPAAPLNLTVGAGGVGGAAVTADDTNGNAGTVGGQTYLGASAAAALLASPANSSGSGGTATTGTAGTAGSAMVNGGAGATASTTGLIGTAGNGAAAGPGGGSGGGITSADAVSAGGSGARWLGRAAEVVPAAGTSGGGNGENGTSPMLGTPGTSGAGGGSSKTSNAGNGGAGGRAAGGGSGGATLNAVGNSGAGGNGGDGFAVITWIGD